MLTADRLCPWDDPCFALVDGETVTLGDDSYALSVVDCGELNLEGGQLIACDPFAGMLGAGRDAWIPVPPGRYPVRVTLADVSPDLDGSHLREAYASLIIKDAEEAHRSVICPLTDDASPTALGPDDYWAFGVDAGTACFADKTSIDRDMPDPADWLEGVFDNDDPGCWFHRMDDPDHIRPGLANIPLPEGDGQTNIIIIHSGWGDGFFPVLGGFDDSGELVAVHIDFLVVIPPAPQAAETPKPAGLWSRVRKLFGGSR